MLYHVAHVRTGVSEEHIASIIRVRTIRGLGTKLAVTSMLQRRRRVLVVVVVGVVMVVAVAVVVVLISLQHASAASCSVLQLLVAACFSC
jgi:hypothetical protein